MSYRLKPISEEDCQVLYGETVASEGDIKEPDFPSLLSTYKRPLAKAHVRQFIHLHLPVVNMAVCGTSGGELKKFLALAYPDITLSDILEFKTCYEVSSQEFIDVEHCGEDSMQYLFGAQLIEKLLSEIDFEEVVVGYLSYLIAKLFAPEPFYITKQKSGIPVYADYYVQSNKVVTEESVREIIDSAYKKNKLTAVNMYINLLHQYGDDANEYLRGMVIRRDITLVPMSLRPASAFENHPLTAAYIRLFNHNNNYRIHVTGPVGEFVEYYRELERIVAAITVDNQFTNRSDSMWRLRPILQTMGGKTGMVRAQFLKKRQDYSGRSVVVIDPYMPLNMIGIPKTMVHKLYRRFEFSDTNLNPQEILDKIDDSEFEKKIVKELQKSGVISEIPILLGRNPTLHKLGIQGFHVKVVEGRAIRVNPLVCPAFNMDFDGDTAHTEIPMTPKAQHEVRELILTDKNIFLGKTGECTICPRMDIIYGLYMSTIQHAEEGANVGSYEEPRKMWDDIYKQKITIWDTATLAGYGTGKVGNLAVKACFPKSFWDDTNPLPEITSKTIKPYITKLSTYPTVVFEGTINNLVEYGFHIAYLYCRSVSMLQGMSSNENFDTAVDRFHKALAPIDEMNDLGFYDEESYGIEYGRCADIIGKTYESEIMNKVTKDNMFYLMAKSGARGNSSNLVQIYGSKGRIQRSDHESFNVIIERGLHKMLTPMEHGIAANGARKGQIAKSIKTADTGYLGRKLAHTSASIIIREDDCGTKDGIEITKDMVESYFYKEDQKQEDFQKTVRDVFAKLITGRYEQGTTHLITEREAKMYASDSKVKSVKIRSPLTCSNPCCAKCYGINPETNKPVIKGTAVGIIAAQSLSEPSTQMTMKVFQAGGVAGAAASPFDRLSAIFSQTDIYAKARNGEYPMYDPVAWTSGTLRQAEASGSNVVLTIEPDNGGETSVRKEVPGNVTYKIGRHVKAGENLRIVHGDTYTKEVLQGFGLRKAQMDTYMNLYKLYKSQLDIVPVHIELMVSCMTQYTPIITDVKELKLGKYYTRAQLCTLGKDYSRTTFKEEIRGVGSIITSNVNFMESFIVEDQRKVLSSAVFNGAVDLGDSPLLQMALGKVPKLGTGYSETYIDEFNGG